VRAVPPRSNSSARATRAAACAIAVVAAMVGAQPAAGEPAAQRSRAGVTIGGLVPLDGWRDATGPAGGAGVWLEVPVSPHVVVTARAGVVVHAPATVTLGARLALIEIPLLGGARLEVARRGRLRGLLGGDVGLVVTHERVSLGGVTEGDASLRFGAALIAGVAFDRYALELGPWLADLTDLDHAIGVQLTLSARLRSW